MVVLTLRGGSGTSPRLQKTSAAEGVSTPANLSPTISASRRKLGRDRLWSRGESRLRMTPKIEVVPLHSVPEIFAFQLARRKGRGRGLRPSPYHLDSAVMDVTRGIDVSMLARVAFGAQKYFPATFSDRVRMDVAQLAGPPGVDPFERNPGPVQSLREPGEVQIEGRLQAAVGDESTPHAMQVQVFAVHRTALSGEVANGLLGLAATDGVGQGSENALIGCGEGRPASSEGIQERQSLTSEPHNAPVASSRADHRRTAQVEAEGRPFRGRLKVTRGTKFESKNSKPVPLRRPDEAGL